MKNTQKYLDYEDCGIFCHELSVILQAGIPLHQGMQSLKETYADTKYGNYFAQISEQLDTRGTLNEALSESKIFPPYLVAMVKIGEVSGKLDSVTEQLATYYENQAEIQKNIKHALVYPAVLLGLMAIVIIILVTQVLPIFKEVFAGLGVDINTNQYVNFGVILSYVALVIIGILLVLAIIFLIMVKTGNSKKAVSILGKIVPSIKKMQTANASGRFASEMALLLDSGYQAKEAMELIKDTLDDEEDKEKMVAIEKEMSSGVTFSKAVSDQKLFEPLHLKMIQIGQMTGTEVTTLNKLAKIYHDEVNNNLTHLLAVLEPTLVGILAVVVGIILLAVILPLLGILAVLG